MMQKCSVAGCDKSCFSDSLCIEHWRRRRMVSGTLAKAQNPIKRRGKAGRRGEVEVRWGT